MKNLSLDRCTINNMINCISDELKKIRINIDTNIIEMILDDGIEIKVNNKKIKVNRKNIAAQPKENDMEILNAIADKYFQDPHYKDLKNVNEYKKLKLRSFIRDEIRKILI